MQIYVEIKVSIYRKFVEEATPQTKSAAGNAADKAAFLVHQKVAKAVPVQVTVKYNFYTAMSP